MDEPAPGSKEYDELHADDQEIIQDPNYVEPEEAQPVKSDLPDEHPGVEHGTVLDTGETVIHETDEDGNLTGWHKEAPAEGEEPSDG